MELIMQTPPISSRKLEIARDYITVLDQHIRELKEGRVDRALEIRDFAAKLHIHAVHLSNTVREATGKSTCELYEERLVRISKELLISTNMPVAQIARQLTYDPSNFTKFFRHFTGTTPKKFRDVHANGIKS